MKAGSYNEMQQRRLQALINSIGRNVRYLCDPSLPASDHRRARKNLYTQAYTLERTAVETAEDYYYRIKDNARVAAERQLAYGGSGFSERLLREHLQFQLLRVAVRQTR